MNNRSIQINLADTLNKTTYVVDAFEDAGAYERDERYSSGTAVAVSEDGDLITAAHVLTGSSTKVDNLTGHEIIVARTSAGPLRSYRIAKCGILIDVPKAFTAPLLVDLAYLRPRENLSGLPFLPIRNGLIVAGEPVLMAGYSDELEPPLSYHRLINYSNPAYAAADHQTAKKVRLLKQLLMIKSGMVGQSQYLQTHADTQDDEISIEAYYVDNGMHSGASGGPIITMEGELIGIIVKRAVTIISNLELSDPNMEVPSGSTLGLHPAPIVKMLNRK